MKKRVTSGALALVFASVILSIVSFADLFFPEYDYRSGNFEAYIHNFSDMSEPYTFFAILGLLGALLLACAFIGIARFGLTSDQEKTPSFAYAITLGMLVQAAVYVIRLYVVMVQVPEWIAAPAPEQEVIEELIVRIFTLGTFLTIAGVLLVFALGVVLWSSHFRSTTSRGKKVLGVLLVVLGLIWIGMEVYYILRVRGMSSHQVAWALFPHLPGFIATLFLAVWLISISLTILNSEEETLKQVKTAAAVVGAVSCLLIGILTLASITVDLLSGIYYIDTGNRGDVGYIIDSLMAWYYVGTLKETAAVLGFIAVTLSIPAAVGIAVQLRAKLGKSGKLATTAIIFGSVLMLIYYLYFMRLTSPWPPVTEHTPPAALPGIAVQNWGVMMLTNIFLCWGSIVTYTIGFGALAFKLRGSGFPKGIWILGLVQGLIALSGLGVYTSGLLLSVSMILSIGGTVIFSIWMILLSVILYRRIAADSVYLVKGSGFAFIIVAAFLILAVILNALAGFWGIEDTGDMLNVPMIQFSIVGILGLGVAIFASLGIMGIWRRMTGRRRYIPIIGMFTGLLLLFCAFVMIPILFHIVQGVEFSYIDYTAREMFRSQLGTTLLSMDILFIVGVCLVFTFGNIFWAVFNKELALPSIYRWLNLILGLVGIACAVFAFFVPSEFLFDAVSQIVIVVMINSFILMGIGMIQYREPVSYEEPMEFVEDEGGQAPPEIT